MPPLQLPPPQPISPPSLPFWLPCPLSPLPALLSCTSFILPPASPASFAALHSVHPATLPSSCFGLPKHHKSGTRSLEIRPCFFPNFYFLVTSHLITSWAENKSFHAFLCYFVQIIKKVIQLQLKSYITVAAVVYVKTSVPTLLLNLATPQVEEAVLNQWVIA